ncbi:MAG: hypothetical protein AB1714_22805 [Acidobacteriota bacterium]
MPAGAREVVTDRPQHLFAAHERRRPLAAECLVRVLFLLHPRGRGEPCDLRQNHTFEIGLDLRAQSAGVMGSEVVILPARLVLADVVRKHSDEPPLEV